MINLQLFGPDCPPLYGKKDLIKRIDEISKIDEKINALLIEREEYVENLKKAIEEENSSESED